MPSRGPTRRRTDLSGPELTVGRGVIAELVRLAAFEVPGVVARRPRRAGLAALARRARGRRSGSATSASLVRLWVVARPGPGARAARRAQVRTTVAATVERLLGLELGTVTVLVDGVGG